MQPTWMDLDIVPLVYVAGPFGDEDEDVVRQNVLRACSVSLFAVTMGLSPIVPHPGIMAGAFGKEASSAERERGIRMVIVQVRFVAQSFDGRFWAIRTPSGGLSSGTHREMEAFAREYHDRHGLDAYRVNAIVSRTWEEWATAIPPEIINQASLPWQEAQVPKKGG